MKIEDLRKQIDSIDLELLGLLKKRKGISIMIGKIKQKNGIPIFQKKREFEVLDSIKKKSISLGIDQDMAVSIFRKIIGASRKDQKRIGMKK